MFRFLRLLSVGPVPSGPAGLAFDGTYMWIAVFELSKEFRYSCCTFGFHRSAPESPPLVQLLGESHASHKISEPRV
jgi:hypothetical protein